MTNLIDNLSNNKVILQVIIAINYYKLIALHWSIGFLTQLQACIIYIPLFELLQQLCPSLRLQIFSLKWSMIIEAL